MEDLNVVDSINGAGSWLVANQALLLSYASKHRGGTRDHHRWFDYRADDFQRGESPDDLP
ncbi:mechanosensitive channel MscS [Escherichia coli]|nr:mechanosensitive channel MscS [Escherichia coli]